MLDPVRDTVLIEGARVIFRNFAGKEDAMNREGNRNFCVLLDDEVAEAMANDGWNIKQLRPREEGETPQSYIQVSVGYKVRPPKVVMITTRGKTEIGEDLIEMLDYAEFGNVDLIFQPYNWDVNGKSGVKAYLKSLFVEVIEDALEQKYGDVPDVQSRSGSVDE